MLRWTRLANKDAAPASPNGTLHVGSDGLTEDERLALEELDRFYGMENFGNTCYANSVLQALYFCRPFRECVNTYPSLESPYIPIRIPKLNLPLPQTEISPTSPGSPPIASTAAKTSRWPGSKKTTPAAAPAPEPTPSSDPTGSLDSSTMVVNPSTGSKPPATLFIALQTLFRHIAAIPPPIYGLPPKDKDGNVGPPVPLTKTVVAPAAFVGKLKMENEMFRGTMQQDAHEFLNYLLNKVGEDLELEEKERKVAEKKAAAGDSLAGSVASFSTHPSIGSSTPRRAGPEPTFVHKLFQGTLTNETRCLSCETTSSRDESFLDLSIDIEQNTSITACLRQFSASETLCQRNKFYCDNCCALQEAEKRMKIKTLPNILALHLKRFKYQEDVGRYVKLSYRVVFPFQLRLFNTSDDTENPDRLYELFAIVVHVGGGPHHGHYIAIVKTDSGWTQFDDETVSAVNEEDIQKYFGESAAGSGYVLFYQAVDLNTASLGLRRREPAPAPPSPLVPESIPILSSNPSNTVPTLDPTEPVIIPPPVEALDESLTPMPSPSQKKPAALSLSSDPPRAPIQSAASSSLSTIPPSPAITTSSNLETDLAASTASTSPSLSRSLGSVLGRSPLPPSMQRLPSTSASSTISHRSNTSTPNSPSVSSPPSPSIDKSLTMGSKSKDRESGSGWFSRRPGKEKAERRISSSSTWYGSLASVGSSSGAASGVTGAPLLDPNTMGRERQQTVPTAPLTTILSQNEADENARLRQPSAPGLLESRVTVASLTGIQTSLGLHSLGPPSSVDGESPGGGGLSSSIASLDAVSSSGGLPSPMTGSMMSGRSRKDQDKFDKKERERLEKEREKVEKEALKRQKLDRKTSAGPSSMARLGGLSTLGRSSSMALFGKKKDPAAG